MDITRIDYTDDRVAHLPHVSKGQTFYRDCDPATAITRFQAMCRDRGYAFTITCWHWFSPLNNA